MRSGQKTDWSVCGFGIMFAGYETKNLLPFAGERFFVVILGFADNVQRCFFDK